MFVLTQQLTQAGSSGSEGALGSLGDEGLSLFFAFMDAHEHEEQRAGKETSLLREKL